MLESLPQYICDPLKCKRNFPPLFGLPIFDNYYLSSISQFELVCIATNGLKVFVRIFNIDNFVCTNIATGVIYISYIFMILATRQFVTRVIDHT